LGSCTLTVAPMGMKFGTEEGTRSPPCQISPSLVQRVARAGRKTSKSASDYIKYRWLALRAMRPVIKIKYTQCSSRQSHESMWWN